MHVNVKVKYSLLNVILKSEKSKQANKLGISLYFGGISLTKVRYWKVTWS